MNCCRLCGQEEERGRLQCLFEKESLIENVHHFLQIQIFEEDPLSHEICETCEDTVKKIVDFVTECQKMQRQLYKLSNLQRTKADNIVKVKCEPVSFGEPGMKCEFVEDDTLSSSLDNAEYSITASELLFPAGQSSSRNYSSSNVSSSRVPNNSIHYDLQNCDNDNGEILPEFQNLPSSSDENVVLLEENPWKKEEFGYSEQDDNEKTLSTVTPESTLASLPSSSAGNMEDVISTVIEESLSSTKTNDRKEFIPSARGHPRLIEDGHMYYCEKKVDDKIMYWKCQYMKKLRCPARVTTTGNEITSRWKSHNHLGDAAKIELAKIRSDIKVASRSTLAAPEMVIAQCLGNASQNAVESLPKVHHIVRNIRNTRARNCSYPPLPESRKDICLPPGTTKTSNGDNFVLYDSGSDEYDRIMVLGTLANLKILSRCTHWFTDGSFPFSPHLFEQIYTIHGLIDENEQAIALVYALLPNKSETTYLRLLNKIKELEPYLNPELVIVDYEEAAINAFKEVFPSAILQGSFFHFTQTIIRQVCTSGFKESYEKEVEFALRVRHLLALAFLPTSDVVETFKIHLKGGLFYPSEFQRKVLAQFEDTWIGHLQENGARLSPTFPLELWNCRESVLFELLKINNVVERWHRSFNRMLQCLHAHLFKLIEALVKEQLCTEEKYEQLRAGKRQKKKPPQKYKDAMMQLQSRVDMYYEGVDPLKYLRGVAQKILS